MGAKFPIVVAALALSCGHSTPEPSGGEIPVVEDSDLVRAHELQILSVEPKAGALEGGNEVRISCTGLSGGETVFFAGRVAAISKRIRDGDRHTLFVKAPRGPSGMSVDVVIVGTGQATLERAYTYADRPVKLPSPQVVKKGVSGLELCEEYFDLIEKCMVGTGMSSASTKKALKNARKSMRDMAESATQDKLDAMNESCSKAMETAHKTFKNCP